jgi:porphobilinogen synthase
MRCDPDREKYSESLLGESKITRRETLIKAPARSRSLSDISTLSATPASIEVAQTTKRRATWRPLHPTLSSDSASVCRWRVTPSVCWLAARTIVAFASFCSLFVSNYSVSERCTEFEWAPHKDLQTLLYGPLSRRKISAESDAVLTSGPQDPDMDLTDRPRRLRRDGIRGMVSETDADASDLIAPVFVDATTDERVPIETMPGHERVPVERAVARVEEVRETGVEAVMLFGIPESKDERGSRAWAEDGVVQEATRRVTAETDAYVITDVCLCEYTRHGHCGVLTSEANEGREERSASGVLEEGAAEGEERLTVRNDETLDLLGRIATSHAEAGADMVAPSGMMDGMVGAIRESLDGAGFSDVPIMSYAAKYESAFYGPFRDAADGAPAFGDRRHYQMDPANRREAMREVRLDVEQGADVLMVKPALPYLDVVRDVREEFDHPVAAYNVSGEYAMLHAASEKGWLELEEVALESLVSIKRAGADLILTYFAEDVAEAL